MLECSCFVGYSVMFWYCYVYLENGDEKDKGKSNWLMIYYI